VEYVQYQLVGSNTTSIGNYALTPCDRRRHVARPVIAVRMRAVTGDRQRELASTEQIKSNAWQLVLQHGRDKLGLATTHSDTL